MSSGPFIAPDEIPHVLQRGGPFHDGFQAVVRKLPGWQSLGIALVDLTTGTPKYATTAQEHQDKHVFSLAKIAPLLAAFRLRERLRNQFGNDPARDPVTLLAKIEKAWKPIVHAQVAGRPGRPDFPRLTRIFDLNGPPWTFRFLGESAAPSVERDKLVWKYLKSIDDKYDYGLPKDEVEPLVFLHRMKLMIRRSDNMAAGSVASDVGLSYMFGVMVTDGLYDKRVGRGLWLSNTYGYDDKFMGYEGSGVQLTAGATAWSVAEYLTRLHLKKLVDAEASEQMLGILKFVLGLSVSSAYPTKIVVEPGGRRRIVRKPTHGKLGYHIKGDNTSDGSCIESLGTNATGGLTPVTYVAVGLQDVGGNRMSPLIDLMDGYVKRVNGLT